MIRMHLYQELFSSVLFSHCSILPGVVSKALMRILFIEKVPRPVRSSVRFQVQIILRRKELSVIAKFYRQLLVNLTQLDIISWFSVINIITVLRMFCTISGIVCHWFVYLSLNINHIILNDRRIFWVTFLFSWEKITLLKQECLKF